MLFQRMSLEEAKKIYKEATTAKGNALCKIVCDDIYFFTDGLTKDYGGWK